VTSVDCLWTAPIMLLAVSQSFVDHLLSAYYAVVRARHHGLLSVLTPVKLNGSE